MEEKLKIKVKEANEVNLYEVESTSDLLKN